MKTNEPITNGGWAGWGGALFSPQRLYLSSWPMGWSWVWREGEGAALPWEQYCWYWPLRAAGMSWTERCHLRRDGACARIGGGWGFGAGGRSSVGLPGGRELNLTCWACVLLILLLLVIVWDKLGSVYGVRGGDLGFEVGGVSLRRRRRGAVVVSGGGACGRRGLVIPG